MATLRFVAHAGCYCSDRIVASCEIRSVLRLYVPDGSDIRMIVDAIFEQTR